MSARSRRLSAMLAVIVIAYAPAASSQSDLSAEQRQWINETCPRSLGPSLWRICVDREEGALLSRSPPEISSLSSANRQWVLETCHRTLGPSLFGGCVRREVEALQRAGWPDLAHLTINQRNWVNETCHRSLGPSLWRSCAGREAAALAPTPRATSPRQPVPRDQPIFRSPLDHFKPHGADYSDLGHPVAKPRLPPWSGQRPAMPSRFRTQDLPPPQIFAAASSSVYLVIAGASLEALARGNGTMGSAVAVTAELALTNCHVVKQQPYIAIVGDSFDRTISASVAYADERSDRCFLRVSGGLIPIAAVRSVQGLAVGERVYTIGNPSGLTKTLGEGLISGLRTRDGINYVQTSAPISAGSSGGALLDGKGALVGITTFLLRDAQNLNFAIAAEEYWR